MAIEADDAITFDVAALTASEIREDTEYGGIRLKTLAYLDRTRVPVTLDIAFGDALTDATQHIEYPSLLGMERPDIRSYPPAAVIAEKFQAVVALGLANGRMKDFYDLWAVPRTLTIEPEELDNAIAATFARRGTPVPTELPVGLSPAMAQDAAARQRWRAYIESLDLPAMDYGDVLADIWASLAPSCAQLVSAREAGR